MLIFAMSCGKASRMDLSHSHVMLECGPGRPSEKNMKYGLRYVLV